MEAHAIHKALVALAQEAAHWHMVNGAPTLGDVELRLERHYPIDNEKNITYITVSTYDIIDFMSKPKIAIPTTIIVGIQDKLQILTSALGGVTIEQQIEARDEYQIYDYEQILKDVTMALGTGRELDLKSYNQAAIIKDAEAQK